MELHSNNMNREDGLILSGSGKPLIHSLEECRRHTPRSGPDIFLFSFLHFSTLTSVSPIPTSSSIPHFPFLPSLRLLSLLHFSNSGVLMKPDGLDSSGSAQGYWQAFVSMEMNL